MRVPARVGRGLLGVAVAAALCAAPGAAAAQKSGDKLQSELDDDQGGIATGPDVHAEGAYGGVVPGNSSGKSSAPPNTKRLIVSWIGFLPKGPGSRLFVQLTKNADFDQRLVGDKLIVTIPGARFGSRNERRRLDMRFFDTSLRQVVPKRVRRKRRRRAGVALHITFKNPADARTASAQLSKEKDGYHYLYLDFGPGTTPSDTAK